MKCRDCEHWGWGDDEGTPVWGWCWIRTSCPDPDIERTCPDFSPKAPDIFTSLSTLQGENEKLRAELEEVKSERAVALEHLHGICSACKNYSPYHNRGKCRSCAYEPARDKDAEANDNWEWRGPQKED